MSFYGALSRAASFEFRGSRRAAAAPGRFAAHHKQLQLLGDELPGQFRESRCAGRAEIARIEGRTLDAMDLYERAIRSARANGFVHNEALAYEIAARFYLARGFETFGHAYLRNARHCYDSWGALWQGAAARPALPAVLREELASSAPTATIGAPSSS